MHRRQYLLGIAGSTAALIAGCSGEDSTDQDEGTVDNATSGGDESSNGDTDAENDDSDTGEPIQNGEDDESDGAGGEESTDDGSGDDSSGDGPVEILEHEWYNEGEFDAGVRGQVENRSGDTLGYVQVEVNFLDEDEVQFEDGLDNTTDLSAGRVWEFDVMFLGDDPERVASYEIEASTSAV